MKKFDWTEVNYKKLAPFRFKKIKDKYLLVNETSDFLFLEETEWQSFLKGELKKDSEAYLTLIKNNFIKGELDLNRIIQKYHYKKNYVYWGPSLHIIVVSLRCNHNCIYCHASARGVNEKTFDMSIETADKVLEKIFDTTNPFVAIEFQGGEPMLNWSVVDHFIKKAPKIAKKKKKDLEIRLVTNASLLTPKLFDYLLANKVSLCISFDGPEKLHNKNRPFMNGNSYKNVAKYIKKFNKIYPELVKKKYIWQIGSAMTVTRDSLPLWKEIVDSHVELGLKRIYLRSLNPFGFSLNSWKKISYPVSDFLDFYRKSMDYIIDLNLKGTEIQERLSLTFLVKMLSDYDLNHMDFRSPCGASIGQMAYNYNGDVYTCDEGRMLSMMGDESFRIGNVYKNTYKEIIMSPVTKTLCTASCLEGLSSCSNCVYKVYCGVCPIYNYSEQGNVFSQMANNDRCKMIMGIMDYLFEKMQNKDVYQLFHKWVEQAIVKMK